MSVGITFGCYSPLHQGHLDVIMRAKKENDKCVVIVCGSKESPRETIPLIKRYRIISNFLKNENVYVHMISDDELGIDDSMSDSNWRLWLDTVRLYLEVNGLEGPYNWYVSESEYVEPINKYFGNATVNLMSRENDISGTACRTNPLANWNKITAPFRAYYSHNILITGTASEGKTTLVEDIGRYFNLPYSYEKGRDNCKLKTDPELTVKDFMYNIYEQHKYNEDLIASPQNPGVFISDTDNLVTLMYAKKYAFEPSFELSKSDYEALYIMAKMYLKTTKWDKIFFIAPHERPIVDDGERYMGHSDFAIRCSMADELLGLYTDNGYKGKVQILDGDYYSNFCIVRDYINSLYE